MFPHFTPAKKGTVTDDRHWILCGIAYYVRWGHSQADIWPCDSGHMRLNASDCGLGTKAPLTISVFWTDLVRRSSAVYEPDSSYMQPYFLGWATSLDSYAEHVFKHSFTNELVGWQSDPRR